jgi:hypothetical protein
MYKTIKTRLYLKRYELELLKPLSKASNSLYDEALYNVRQHFFNTSKYLSYYDNDPLCRNCIFRSIKATLPAY